MDGAIVKTEVTKEQWKELHNFNKQALRQNLKYYDDVYFSRFSVFEDEAGNEDDPMEYQADFETRFIETDTCERLDRERLLKGLTKAQQTLYYFSYERELSQEEIAKQLHIEQYRVSRMLKELDALIYSERLDDGSRDETELQVDYLYDRYRRTGRLEHYENVVMDDFLSNLLPQEDERLRCWFYTQSELYRYGIKFLIEYKLKDFSARNVYREMFTLKDLTARGYFIEYMTDLPLEYQWLYLHLEKEIERRSERFAKPEKVNHKGFIKELVKVAKKANMKPMGYYKTKLLPYMRSKYDKQGLQFAKKELGFYVVQENDSRPISEQIEEIIKRLPNKAQKYWQTLNA